MIFEQEFTVRYSEIGPDGCVELARVMAWFQDAATDHSQSVGYGAEVLKQMGAAWIILHWDVNILAPILYNQRVRVQTWASGFSAAYGHRMFALTDMEGNKLAEAESVWILYDLEQNKFKKVSTEMCARYGCTEKMPAEVLRKWKLDVPQTVVQSVAWTVLRSDTDTNGHTNNVSYVRKLTDWLGDEETPQHIRVTYKKSLYLRDEAQLQIGKNTAAVLRNGEVCTLFEFE